LAENETDKRELEELKKKIETCKSLRHKWIEILLHQTQKSFSPYAMLNERFKQLNIRLDKIAQPQLAPLELPQMLENIRIASSSLFDILQSLSVSFPPEMKEIASKFRSNAPNMSCHELIPLNHSIYNGIIETLKRTAKMPIAGFQAYMVLYLYLLKSGA